MNQQAFNLLGAFLAIGMIAGIWFYFAEDVDSDDPSEPRSHGQPSRSASQSQRDSRVHSYYLHYPLLKNLFEKPPEIVITARPNSSVSSIASRQDSLLAAILGEQETSPQASNESLNHLKGILLNPSASAAVNWRPVVGSNPPVHPVALAHEFNSLSPQESMDEEFKRLLRFANSDNLPATISDLERRIARWRHFHASNPSGNAARNTTNSRYLNAIEQLVKLLESFQRSIGMRANTRLTQEQARQHWPQFETRDLPQLAEFINSSTVERVPVVGEGGFETALSPDDHSFFLSGSIYGRTVYIQILPKANSALHVSAEIISQ